MVLDLTQLYPLATNLDLVVLAADKPDGPVRHVLRQIARLVQPLLLPALSQFREPGWVLNKCGGRLDGFVDIPKGLQKRWKT